MCKNYTYIFKKIGNTYCIKVVTFVRPDMQCMTSCMYTIPCYNNCIDDKNKYTNVRMYNIYITIIV